MQLIGLATKAYLMTLTGEKIGWVVHKSATSFSLAHEVQVDPERGPVIVIKEEVFEVPENAEVYATRSDALAAYYAKLGQ